MSIDNRASASREPAGAMKASAFVVPVVRAILAVAAATFVAPPASSRLGTKPLTKKNGNALFMAVRLASPTPISTPDSRASSPAATARDRQTVEASIAAYER